MADGQHGEIRVATIDDALLEAQKAYKKITRDKQGGRGKYAPLETVIEAVKSALHANGCYLTQPSVIDGELLIVRSLVVHAPTQAQRESVWPVGNIVKQQTDLGAALTFARRYSLLGLLGLAPEGEDAPQQKGKDTQPKGAGDLTQAAGALRVKLTGAVSMADLQRIWGANTRLLNRLDTEDPEARVRLGQLFDDRVMDFNSKAVGE